MAERRCKSGLHVMPEGKDKCPQCANARIRSRRAGVASVECPVCHQMFQHLSSRHTRIHGFPNIQEFKAHFGLDSCVTPEEKERVSRFFSGRPAPHMSKDNGQRGRKRTAESRAKMSAAAVERCTRNPGPLFSRIRGEWIFSEKADQDVYVRSSYEKRLIRALDQHPDVRELKVEPYSIPYCFKGVQLQYIPDLLVTLGNEGELRELWEVKPKKFIDDPQNQAKFQALCGYAHERGMNAAMITLEDIERIERRVVLLTALAK